MSKSAATQSSGRRLALLVVCVLAIGLDVALGLTLILSSDTSTFFLISYIAGGIYAAGDVIASVIFIRETLSFVRMIEGVVTSSREGKGSASAGGEASGTVKLLGKMSKWLFISAIAMLCKTLTIPLTMTPFLWTRLGWMWIWAFIMVFRWGSSIS